MFTVKKLTMDYMTSPAGLVELPQFAWVLESDQKNVVQKAYQLQISEDEGFAQLVFDSGLTESDDSAHVCISGLELKEASRYFVRVKAVNNYQEETDWSEAAHFITGLFSPESWKGEFISAETREDADVSKGTYVRNEFSITKEIKEAFAYTTALGIYHYYINGEKVGEDLMAPGWTSYKQRLLYQTHDVTDLLKKGGNAAGATLGAGWYKGKMGFESLRNIYGSRTAFLCQIVVRYTDGSTEILKTDSSWQGGDSPVVFSEIYDGETYDARLEQDGWNETGFSSDKFRAVEIVEQEKDILVPQTGCSVKEIETLPVKEIITTPEGDTVLNFGQNLTGFIRFKVSGKAGDKVELNCFEMLDAKGNVYLDNLRTAKETLTYICKGEGEEVYQPLFSFQGFQYAKVASWPGEIKPEYFSACVVHSDMERTGDFTCSNPDINQLQHNILWGLKGNFLDVPTDCPQRDERLGWTGDAQIFCYTATYLMNTHPFFSKWLKDVAADQTPEGGVPHIVPDILDKANADDWLISQGTHSATAWADVAVINPYTLYLCMGDKKIIEEQYQSMKNWIEFMRAHTGEDGIWRYRLQFGDWVALDAEEGSYFGATPNELTCTAYYAYVSRLFAKMARAVGNEADYEEYMKLYEEVKATFQRQFYNEDGTMTARTQTAHILALYFELAPEQHKEKTIQTLLELLKEQDGHLVTGFVGTPYFCHALSQNGHKKEAYELLLKDDFPSWLYQVKAGATTVWEHWDGLKPDGTMWSPDMNSFNHYAYGAVGEWLYRTVAGINPDEQNPGYKHIIIRPQPGGSLTYAQGIYQSIYGTIISRWETTETGKINLHVEIPVNTTADIYLGEHTDTPVTVGSGVYEFEYHEKL